MGKIKTVVGISVPMAALRVIGIRCEKPPEEVAEHFISIGVEAVVFDPDFICGADHAISSYMHAERAFLQGTQRSRGILTETILYASADRQIGRALKKMGPKVGDNAFVVLIIGELDDLALSDIDAERDDSLVDCTEESARNMGLYKSSIPYTDLILERIASVDIMKY
ncbi:MAG: KEOPS complex subunit Cgi121 [Candidatus Methanomethylophilaceae archaeon]|nr:KEOPS complex subunit Cgi121 [Candidatus Methanomethylophilaceae archaeon]MDD3987146.1 KEOPS complex subunit Cgi121 [Candidatus Methanomethylophilaceae archaeon]MDD4708634.1 KEOPS complex subunit Cgi121 [Candidatus Methanomethylophilaceae archaeon]MDY0251720.1 KEOPS complex subunit Cgi121 [Candidatus Methanomethylophilaceae archaeon]